MKIKKEPGWFKQAILRASALRERDMDPPYVNAQIQGADVVTLPREHDRFAGFVAKEQAARLQ